MDMKTFNRVTWPLVALLLVIPEVWVTRAGHLPAIIPMVLIQMGLVVFIAHDWRRLPASPCTGIRSPA